MKSYLFIFSFLAISFCSQAKNFDSKKVIERGIQFYDNDQFNSAAQEFLKVPLTDTNYLLAQYELALTYTRDSNTYKKALEVIEASKKVPFNAYELSLSMLEGAMYDRLENSEKAHAVYADVLKKYPEYPQAYYEKAVVYYLEDDYANAIDYFKKSLIRNPYHFRSHYLLGVNYYLQGRIAESMIATQFAMMASADKSQSQMAAQQLSFLSKGSDTLINRSKAMKSAFKNASFDEMTEVLLSRVSSNEKYQLKTDLDDRITRQLQVVYELAEYKPSDDRFVNQYYVPFIQDVWKKDRFNEFMLYLFSDLGVRVIDKKVKKNKKSIIEVREEIYKYFSKISATRELNYQTRSAMTNKYLAEGQDLIVAQNELKNTGKEEEYVYTGPYMYYSNGVLRAEGNFNSNNKKEGFWKYYSPLGLLLETENYSDGDLSGWEKEFTGYGFLERESFYNEDERRVKMKEYKSGNLVYQIIENVPDEPVDFTLYHANGKERAHYVQKNGNPVDGGVSYFYDNGQLASKLNVRDAKTEGAVTRYNRNGTLSAQEEYTEDKLNGTSKYYYENGNLKSEYTYVKDELNGPFKKYFLDGKLEAEGEYKNGKYQGELKSYKYDGKLLSTIQYKNGLVTESKYEDAKNARYNNTPKFKEHFFYADGNIASDLKNNSKGMLEGRSTYYYYSGKKSESVVFSNGKREGKSVYYSMSGSKILDRNYVGNELNGNYISYGLGGDTTYAAYYEKDKPVGLVKEYTQGRLTQISQFKDDELQGPTLFYHEEDGTLYKSKWFEGGALIGLMEYDADGAVTNSATFEGGNGIYTTHYRNGNVDFTAPLKNGVFHGDAEKKYFDGKLRETAQYKNGNLVGNRTLTYYNGMKRDFYKYGKEGGIKLYEDYAINGFLDRKITYSDSLDYYLTEFFIANNPYKKFVTQEDEINGQEIYYGPKKEVGGIINYDMGRVVSYTYLDKDGNYVEPISLDGGKGKVLMYYQNGQKCAEFEYKDGYIDGDFKYYYPNGKVGKSRTYENQIIVGSSKEFAENGNEICSFNYDKKGYRDGLYQLNDANGKPMYKANYKNGIVLEKAEMINPSTGKMMQLTYKNNILVGAN